MKDQSDKTQAHFDQMANMTQQTQSKYVAELEAAKKYYLVAEQQYERAEKGEAEAKLSELQLKRVKEEAETYFSEANNQQQRLYSELEETKNSDASARSVMT